MKEKSETDEKAETLSPGDEARSIKVSGAHYRMLKGHLDEVNADDRYTKQIVIRRYMELLIEEFAHLCKVILLKEREEPKDWLEILHKEVAPETEFYTWLKTHMATLSKKSKRNGKSKEKESNQEVGVK